MFFKRTKKTSKVNLGVNEAEGESITSSSVKLMDVFNDDLGVLEELLSQKFIVIGRKGAGKSALASYIFNTMDNEPTDECEIIKHDSIERELNLQGLESGSVLSLDFYKWLVMMKLIELLLKQESLFSDLKAFEKLKEFIEINRGGVRITERKVTNVEVSTSKTNSFEFGVDAKPLKAFMKTNDLSSVKQVKNSPSIYEILPDLERVIDKLLACAYSSANENSYCLIFDDLDIGFNASNEKSVSNLISLLRATKQINHKWAKYHFKCLLLLRDDVERLLSSKESDLNNLFSSYSTHLNWYSKAEDTPELKAFIERRIAKAFSETQGINQATWINLTNMPFKEVVDKTFCRPRDLIAFFEPLSQEDFKYPLSYDETLKLARNYSRHIHREFHNELSSFYSVNEINIIEKVLKYIHKNQAKIPEVLELFNESEVDGVEVLKDLYNRSFIGMRNFKGHVFFKYKFLRGHTFGFELSLEHEETILTHNVFYYLFQDFY
ncbi:P-loop ATPase, Sll1717 family [Vibrio cholerae]|uniref:P-loop ATPase, Sll1717 family n=1 Tax=Vibrio cholerae TaxID=666 RepID=UPI00307FD66E